MGALLFPLPVWVNSQSGQTFPAAQFSGRSPWGRCRLCARGPVSELMTLGPLLPLHSAECELCPSFSLRWEAWVGTTCAAARGLAGTAGSQSDGRLTQPVPASSEPGPCASPGTWCTQPVPLPPSPGPAPHRGRGAVCAVLCRLVLVLVVTGEPW